MKGSSGTVTFVLSWIYGPVFHWYYFDEPNGPIEQAYQDYLISWWFWGVH